MKNNIPYKEIEIGQLYNCNSTIIDDNSCVVIGTVLIIRKYNHVVTLLHNTKLVSVFVSDYIFSTI